MLRDPSGGGFSLFGAPWWVGVIGIVIAFTVVGLHRLLWNTMMVWVVWRARRRRLRSGG